MTTLRTFYRRREIPATIDQQLSIYDLRNWHDTRLITSRHGDLYVTLRRCRGVCCGARADYRRVVIKPDGTIIDRPHGR